MSLNCKFTVALSEDFLESFSELPKTQMKKVKEFISKFKSNPTSSGINYENIIQAKDQNMKSVRIKYYELKSEKEDRAIDGIRMATMHRVKGLEFEHMIIVCMNDSVFPLKTTSADKNEHENLERSLLYVAATRTKRTLLVPSQVLEWK